MGRRTLTLASHCMVGFSSLHARAVAEGGGRGEHDALCCFDPREDRHRAGLGVAGEDDALLDAVAAHDEDAAGGERRTGPIEMKWAIEVSRGWAWQPGFSLRAGRGSTGCGRM